MKTLLTATALAWANAVVVSAASLPGLQVQAYPAGIQASVAFETALSPRDASIVTLGWNEARRWDWGLHDDERGGGPGFGLTWRRNPQGWGRYFYGIGTELWLMRIEWRNGEQRGVSNSFVLQPAVQAGRVFGGPGWLQGDLFLSLGQEINALTGGEAVGQGPILRVGLSVY